MEAELTEQIGQKRGLSGSTLKLIAIVTMLIDHVGATVLGRIIRAGYFDKIDCGDILGASLWFQENAFVYDCYYIMRKIGRVAFPIFIFLMVEGFWRTRSKKKYLLRMAVFALLSEIPFDLAFNAKLLEFSYQNIFFTLLIGMLTMLAFEMIGKTKMFKLWQILCYAAALAAGLGMAELLRTDYGAKGVICIMVVYLFRIDKIAQLVAGSIAFLWELPAPLAFIPIAFYNGKRGLQLKYIFYAFYPLHLLILYLLSVVMGISSCPAL